MSNHHCIEGHVCSHTSSPLYTQSFDELEFERGIWQAAMDGNINDIEKFIAKGTNVNIQDKSGYTALHYASRNGRTQAVKVLLENNAFVNCTTKSGKETPLHRAAYMGHLDIVKLLYGNGASLNMQNIDGQTCLHKAVQQNCVSVVEYLLACNNDLKFVRDSKDKMALDYSRTIEVESLLS